MDDIEERLRAYASCNKLRILERIGFGIHGQVFAVQGSSPFPSVLKAFESEVPYHRERDVYYRLKEAQVCELAGCAVPAMLECSDRFRVIWMTLVTRPFCLDFAAAYLDELPPGHPPFDSQWEAEKREQFGLDWPKVSQVLAALESHGVFQTDVRPTNIEV